MLAPRPLVAACVLLAGGCGSSPAPASAPPPALPAMPTSPSSSSEAPTPGAERPVVPSTARTFALGESVSFGEGTRLTLDSIVTEEIAASPDDPAAYPAGSGATVTLTLAGQRLELTLLSPPYESRTIAWAHDLRVELHETDGETAKLSVQRIGERVLATEPLRIRKGERVRVLGTRELTFVGHSHKSVMAGQESPLLVNVDYHDGHPYPRTHAIRPPREPTWAWEDLRFTLVEWDYDTHMVLTVERRVLEPVPLP